MKVRSMLDMTLILGALLLGGYLAVTAGDPTTGEMEARKNNVLTAFLPDEIQTIELIRPDSGSVMLRRSPGPSDKNRYLLGKTGERVADPKVVGEVISALDFATFQRDLGDAAGAAPETFGFDSPRLEVRVNAGPRTYRLVFGQDAPSPSGAVYLKIEGTNVPSKMGAVKSELLNSLSRSEQEFLGGLLFPLLRSETSELVIDRDGEKLTLTAGPHGFVVKSKGGVPHLVDRPLLDLLFFHLARMKIETYLDENPGDSGELSITQRSPSRPTYIASLGRPCPGDPLGSVIARRTSPEAAWGCIPQNTLPAFRVSAETLASRSPTVMNADEIDHVIVRAQGKTLDLIRDGADYKLLSRGATKIPHEAGDEFIKGFSDMKLAPLAGKPENVTESASVTLKGQAPRGVASASAPRAVDEPQEVQLDVHSGADGALFLYRRADESWFEIPSPLKWHFSANDAWAKERALSTWEANDIDRIEVTMPGGFRQEVQRDGLGYLLLSSPGKKADSALSRSMFTVLGDLHAERFLPEHRDPPADVTSVRFDIKTKDAARTEWLKIGGRIRGGYVAWSSVTDGPFVISTAAREHLETPLADRRRFHINPEDYAELSLELNGREFRFTRAAGLLRAAGGEADDDLIEPLERALEALHVLSAAGEHPAAKRLSRGDVTLRISGTTAPGPAGSRTSFTLLCGQEAVWQGRSTRLCWIEGDDQRYFVTQESLAPLLELL